MNQKEVWKDVKNYVGYYQVSNLGRVKSLERIIIRSNGSELPIKSKLLSVCVCKRGYRFVSLRKPRKKMITKRVHQLIAESFLNHTPCGHKLVVDHIDNDKANNNLSNLQVISHRENSSKDIKNCSSKYTGVYWNKKDNKWKVSIRINGRKKHLGMFNDELEAHKAYQSKLKEINE